MSVMSTWKIRFASSAARVARTFRLAGSARLHARASRIVMAYSVFAILWIYSSDRLLGLLISDPALLLRWSIYKGIGFVAVTSILLLLLMQRALGAVESGLAEARLHELEIGRLQRLYTALCQINQAIVRTSTSHNLFEKVCRVLVEQGGFKMAWIGWHYPDSGLIVPVAEWGDDDAYLEIIKIYADDRPEGRGPTGTAFREGRPIICNDLLNDPSTLLWRAEAGWRGLLASAVFPIRKKGIVRGTLSVYAGQEGVFKEHEIALLLEAAGDLSVALDNLARDADRGQAEAAARSERLFSDAMIESLPGILYLFTKQGRYLRWNRNLERASGYSSEEILQKNPLDLVPRTERQPLEQKIAESFEHGTAVVEMQLLAKDGSTTPYLFTGRPVQFEGVECLIGLGIDITERKRAEAAAAHLAAIVESSDDAIIGNDLSGIVTSWNAGAQRLFGYTAAEIVGQSITRLVPPERREEETMILAKLTRGETVRHFETVRVRKDGSRLDVSVTTSVIRDVAGTVVGISKVARDMTENKQAELRIKNLNRVYAVLSSINALTVRVRNRDELYREACRIAVEEGGFRMALLTLVERDSLKILPVASAGVSEEFMAAMKVLTASREASHPTLAAQATREKRAIVSNDSQNDPRVLFGKEYIEYGVRSVAMLPLVVAGETVGLLALYASEIEFFHDAELKLLTELAESVAFAIDHLEKQERLDYLAYYDAVTGLANRTLFLERVAQYMRSAASSGHQLALFLFDLERFKNVNDSLGRQAGDALLKLVAEWLTRVAGDANLVSRISADHFAMVMPKVNPGGGLVRLMERTLDAFPEHSFHVQDAVLRIAAKVGVALFPDDGDSAETLFRNAEAALKKAKARGDLYLFYTRKMFESSAGMLTLESRLRQALEKDEFVLHYQPKISLLSGEIIGAEALIRWNDPRTGLVPPGQFIPALEETGLIKPVGRWALHKAVEDYLRWRRAGLPAVRIAVNVSPLQLRYRGFIAEVAAAIDVDPAAAAGLELEITESVIMEDINHSIASLTVIREMGISITIDDFGTGFSSLSYLSRLPVDTLKIDRSFVVDMTTEPGGHSMVSTIIDLAHALKLKVVAEGVETEEQSQLLRLMRCDEMQGFLFSKAVPRDIFESRFLTSHAVA